MAEDTFIDGRPTPPSVADFDGGEDLLIIDPKAPLDTARQLVTAHHTTLGSRTLHHQQSIFEKWTGTHYRPLPDEETRSGIYRFLEGAVFIDKKTTKPFKPNQNSVSQVMDALRAACQLHGGAQAPAWLSEDPKHPPANEIIACLNGLLHVPTGRVHPHTPDFFNTSSLSYDYNLKATHPVEWLKFLKSIWGEDQESIDALQDIFGYLLGTDTDQQKLFLFVGPKRSGKGTIARVLGELVGPDAVAAPTLASIQTNFGLAPLIGRSVALIADARLGSKADQAQIAERLLSISGEDRQQIDRKFLPAWNGKLNTRFVIMTNELPRISDASGALASRFVVLTMTKSFYGAEDRGLTTRLLGELPGILNWAIEGWKRIRKRGHFIQPNASAESIRELEDLSSPIGAFLRDCCEVEPGKTVAIDKIYLAWVKWCKEQGRDHAGTKNTFGRDLRSKIPQLKVTQPTEDGERQRKYEGVGLLYLVEKSLEPQDFWERNEF